MRKTPEERLWDWLTRYQVNTDRYGNIINADARAVFDYVMKNFIPKKYE